jgi:hypothetical protein
MAGLDPAIHAAHQNPMTRLRKKPSRPAKRSRAKGRGKPAKPFHPAWGAMKGTIRIMPGVDITQPADPDLADYLDAKYGPEIREK